MGDGARASIALHEDLRRYPLNADAVEGVEPADLAVRGADPALRARMRRDRARGRHAGLRIPRPDE